MEIHEKQTDIEQSIKYLQPRERLFLHGAAYLSDMDLIAIMLRVGTRGKGVFQLAREVLNIYDRHHGNVPMQELLHVNGLGQSKTAILSAASEFFRRRICPRNQKISFPSDVLPLIQHFADRKQEHFLSVSLNGAHEVLSIRVVSVGLVNRTLVHPREVFADPLMDRAAALIIAHNHPSGKVEPSKEDTEVTRRMQDAGDTLGIQILDHIIFSDTGYYSFLEKGEM